MRKIFTTLLMFTAITGCATVAKYSIKDSLIDIGIPKNRAACMAEQLDERLSDDDLRALDRYMKSLSKAATPGQALDALLKVDNPRAVGAITASGVSCAFAPKS
ncbi:MAG: hypothetical protein ACWA5L_06970 [bacterium]